ncbi:hypothetical protein ACOMHN_004229 [Nucella lapillus]
MVEWRGDCGGEGCVVEATRSGAKDLFGSPLEGAAACAAEDSDVEPTVWVCLQCGHQGCDRNSREKHALKHFESPHSGVHCIVANLTTWAAWCYSCDNDIPVESSKRVQECIDFLRKQAGLPRLEFSHFTSQRGAQVTSQSDISPTDPSPPASQSRSDKTQVTGRAPGVACQKVKGLSNLGNTCFFNAVMQNLCQTHSLEALLVSACKKGRCTTIGGWRDAHTDSDSSGDGEEEDDCKMKELAVIDIMPVDPGPLTHSLLSFVQEMNNGSANSTVTPNTLFSHVCKKAPRFKGFQQQDSHELLRTLLDVVRSEEIKRGQSGILKYFKLPESVNPKKVDEETKAKIREYGRQVKYTFLDGLFGGQLVSTVTCEECKHISQIYEPFLDLSLPVTEEKPQRPNQMAASRRKDSALAAAGGGEGHEEKGPPGGVEGGADKPNKYQDLRVRRQARKEARRKGRPGMVRGSGEQGKSVDGGEEEEKVEGGEEEEDKEGRKRRGAMEGPAKGQTGLPLGSSSNGLDGEEDHSNSSPHEDPSDADVEDNVESETSRLNISSGSYNETRHPPTAPHPLTTTTTTTTTIILPQQPRSLQRLPSCDSETDTFLNSLPAKGELGKENHTFLPPPDLSLSCGDSQPGSLDSQGGGGGGRRKDDSETIQKLTNGIGSLELDHADKVLGGYHPRHPPPECGRLEHDRNEPGSLVNHHDSRPDASGGVPTEAWKREGGECGREGLLIGDGASGLEKDTTEDRLITEDRLFTPNGGEAGLGSGLGFGVVTGGGPLPNGDKKTSLPNHMAGKSLKELGRDARYKSKTTLAPRYQPSPKECSVLSCLHQFTAAELLTGSNKVSCKMCTRLRPKNATPHKDKKGSDMVYSNAAKQFLILTPPAVLTLHLKRFEQVGYTSRKVNRHVDFPTVLDLAPYCSSLCQGVKGAGGQRKVLYALYGVVEHSGRLQTGHYTAYVKVRPSLGPLTNFLHQHSSNPRDYIHRYIEQMQVGGGSGVSSVAEEDCGDHQLATEALLPPGRWFHVSDSRINEVTEATVLRAQAYLLFYERVY